MSDPNRLIGHRIDKYLVQEPIKRGGMADVYLAYDEALDRHIALKIALPELAVDTTFVERFRREARAAARLRHANIVQIYATGATPNNENYIAMEYVPGGSLTDLLEQLDARGEALTTGYALALMRQVADALTVAHRAGIVHRDLKPSNILLRRDGTPVLTDLGIAVIKDDPRLTRTHALMGTPNYMSPEQAAGHVVDGRSDIYALGVILYELLAGVRPFTGETPWAVMHKHLYEEPTPLYLLRRDVTAATFEATHTCLRKDPAARFQTADDLVHALDAALSTEGSAGAMTPSGHWTWQQATTSQPRINRDTVMLTRPELATPFYSPTPAAAPTPYGVSRPSTPSPLFTPAPPVTPAPPAAVPARRSSRVWLGYVVGLVLLLPLLYFAWRGWMALSGKLETDLTATAVPVVVVSVETATPMNEMAATTAATAAIAPTETAVPSPTETVSPTPLPTDTLAPTETAVASPSPLPVTPSAAPVTSIPTPSRTTPSPTPNSSNPTSGVSSGNGFPLGFETFGTWVRGDEPNGSFLRSSEQSHSGGSAGKLSYTFNSTSNDYVVFLQNNTISGTPNALQLWVYGDGSAHFLNAWILDANGETWQVPFGQVFHSGWAQMTGYISTGQNWPWTHISGPDNDQVEYPISFRGFVLDDYNSTYIGSGAIYLDDLTATTLSGPIAGVTPAEPTATRGGTPASGSTPTPTLPSGTVPPVGNLGRIMYTSGNTIMTTDPDWGGPLEVGTAARDTCSSPASTVSGQSINLSYGYYCGIGATGTGICTSPNGVYEVVTNRTDNGHSVVVRLAGSDTLNFVYQGTLDTGEGIRWSPLSDSFLFVIGDSVFRAFPTGSYGEIIPTAYTPIFSGDGSMVLYRKPIGPGVNDIFVVNSDGTNARNVTNVAAIDKRCAAWRN